LTSIFHTLHLPLFSLVPSGFPVLINLHVLTETTFMHIHLNTLKYRLKRITELTGVSFRDPSENFYLQLSLRLNHPENETADAAEDKKNRPSHH